MERNSFIFILVALVIFSILFIASGCTRAPGGAVTPPFAANVWISTTGSNTSGAGTYNDPYQTFQKAMSAIASGDLDWIRNNVGELSKEQLMFIYKTLEREVW